MTRVLKFWEVFEIAMKDYPEAAVQRCSSEKVFWKYAANLQENTRAEVHF